MIYDIDIAKQVAKSLLQINAIILQPSNPFKWAAGWNSPIYCDNRKTLSYPEIRNHIRQGLSAIVKNHYKGANVIAGVATGGLPQGALVAQELNLPFIYVRSSAKAHGMGNMIEGHYSKGQKVVLIEDLISTGGSSIKGVEALNESGLNILGLAAIFTYGFEVSFSNFKKANCDFKTLSDYSTLINVAIENNYISNSDLESLQNWREAPSEWNK